MRNFFHQEVSNYTPFNNNIGIQNYIIIHYLVKLGLKKTIASLILTFILA
jgi:hypothetical protein